MNPQKVLIVEDHPIICEAYKLVLKKISETANNPDFDISICNNQKKAFHLVKEEIARQNQFDFIFFDMRIPESKDSSVKSAEDLGIYIRNTFPTAKFVVITSIDSNFRLFNILKTINPDALLTKGELTNESLENAIIKLLNNENVYGKKIARLLKKVVGSVYILDSLDRQILYHLSLGLSTKQLPNYVPLSISGIEKRKRKLACAFELDRASTPSLLNSAREHGYL